MSFLLGEDIGKEAEKERYAVWKADFESISQATNEVNWELMLGGLTIEEAYSYFTNEYERICDKFVPKKRSKKGKNSERWIDDNLKK